MAEGFDDIFPFARDVSVLSSNLEKYSTQNTKLGLYTQHSGVFTQPLVVCC